MTSNRPKLTEGDLAQFTGSDQLYYNPMFSRWKYTDGVKYMAEKAGAYWLIDAILSHQTNKKARAEEFQVWTLKLVPDTGRATLAMTDGNTDRAIILQRIEWTDFPLTEIKFYVENNVLCLPSER